MSPPSSPPSPPSSSETGYTPGQTFTIQWLNTFSYLTGRMTPAGAQQWRDDYDKQHEARDCNLCEENRDWLLANSPTIRFLSEHIQKLGGELGKDNIYCRRCDGQRGGGFDGRFGIDLCANRLVDWKHTEDTLAHEMIHAWDHLRFKVRKDDLRHAACTEIRASNLSGECRFAREVWARGQWKFTQQHQECVRRRAILSVSMKPECKSVEQATKVVDEVWNSCTRDTRPFDEIYR